MPTPMASTSPHDRSQPRGEGLTDSDLGLLVVMGEEGSSLLLSDRLTVGQDAEKGMDMLSENSSPGLGDAVSRWP